MEQATPIINQILNTAQQLQDGMFDTSLADSGSLEQALKSVKTPISKAVPSGTVHANYEQLGIGLATVLIGLTGKLNTEIKESLKKQSGGTVSQSEAHLVVDLWGKHFSSEQLLRNVVGSLYAAQAGDNSSYRLMQLDALVRSLEALLTEQVGQISRLGHLVRFAPSIDWAQNKLRELRDVKKAINPVGLAKLVQVN